MSPSGSQKAKIPIKGDRKSSVFRIHRDVRFSTNKDPYKTNAGVALTRSGQRAIPGVLYFHLSPEECFFAAGFICPSPISSAGCGLGGPRAQGVQGDDREAQESRPRLVGRGFAQARPARLRGDRRSGNRRRDPAQEPDLPQARHGARHRSPALADEFCAFARDALPLLKWGWDALADSR